VPSDRKARAHLSIRFGFVSTYPPTQCGLATFTESLRNALTATPSVDVGSVIRVVDATEVLVPGVAPIIADFVVGDGRTIRKAAAVLNELDVAVVQHEFGIYGGEDGDEIEDLLAGVTIPVIVVLHTVLVDPTPHQREVLESVVRSAAAVVTMTHTAYDRLIANYAVDDSKVSVIPHGAPEMRRAATSMAPVFLTGETKILTWGLIGPGKGIEWALEAMALLGDLDPAPRYTVAGQTHPKVIAREGEAYRTGLAERVRRLGLGATVTLDSRYRDAPALAELVASADIVLLPYDSTEQVTSGVLIEAVAAGKPVVATAFPHAVELLADGAGIVVAHRDPQALADALRTLVTRRDVAARMASKAASTAPGLLWSTVAEEYRALAGRLISAAVPA
jgi:glycosyltransferase involved in cell wall biosynthesis